MENKNESSVFRFLVLTIALFIPFWILEAIHPFDLLPGLPSSALAAFTPALAALTLTYSQYRFGGVRHLLQRCFDFKRIKNAYWFLPILLINPAIAVSAYGIMHSTGIVLPKAASWNLTVIPLLIVLFIAALGEELGWTGYITEQLIERWGTIFASLLLGFIWAAIHFIALLQEHRSFEWIAWWSLGTISYRMIMTWLYVHDGRSLFGAALFHAMINFCWQMFPNNGSHYDPRLFGLIAFVIAVALFAGEQFFRPQHKRFKLGVSNEKIL